MAPDAWPAAAGASAVDTGAFVIVDPIFRGSRLYYSAMMCEAVAKIARLPVQVLTRTHVESDLFPSYRNRFPKASIQAILDVPKDLWYGRVPEAVCSQIVDAFMKLSPGTVVMLAGWNELSPTLEERVLHSGERFPLHIVGYEYNAGGLLEPRRRAQLTRVAERFLSTSVWVLDDSFDVVAHQIPGVRLRWLPDPIPHADSSEVLVASRSQRSRFIEQRIGPGEISFLAVGLQSSRKGLRDIIRAARQTQSEGLPARYFLSGRMAKGEENLAPQVRALNKVFTSRDAYVDDAEILRTYNAADIVLLPYAKDFSNSSGVFAHAMAFGKPVIGTDHGCIGWRIREFGLGLTYPANDPAAMVSAIRTVLAWSPEDWEAFRERCRAYYHRHDYERTLQAIRDETARLPATTTFPPRQTDSAAMETVAGRPIDAVGDPYSFELSSVESIKQVCLLDTGVASRNMDDHIIVDSIKRQLRVVFPDAIFVNVPTHEYLGPESLKLLDSSEVRLVCGTNLLSSHMDQYKQWKIGGLEMAAMRDITLLGCGWWQYQEAPNAYTVLLLNRILSSSTVHSVRDGYSVIRLAGLRGKTVVNTTCPTLWSLTPSHIAGIPDHKAQDVVTTLTDYKADAVVDKFMLGMLLRRYRRVYVWIQGTGDFKYLKHLYPANAPAALRVVPATLEAYDGLLTSSLDLDYVGTRLCAGVRALQKKRRSLILAVDNRAREFSSDTALPCIPREQAPAELEMLIDAVSARRIHLPVNNINRWLRQFH